MTGSPWSQAPQTLMWVLWPYRDQAPTVGARVSGRPPVLVRQQPLLLRLRGDDQGAPRAARLHGLGRAILNWDGRGVLRPARKAESALERLTSFSSRESVGDWTDPDRDNGPRVEPEGVLRITAVRNGQIERLEVVVIWWGLLPVQDHLV